MPLAMQVTIANSPRFGYFITVEDAAVVDGLRSFERRLLTSGLGTGTTSWRTRRPPSLPAETVRRRG